MDIVSGTNYDMWGFNTQVDSIKNALDDGKKPKHLGHKDGLDLFFLKVSKYERFVFLKNGKEYIGMLNIQGDKDELLGCKVGAVYLKNKYRGRGLGTVMYLGAIHKIKKLHSSIYIGEQAVRTWRSLGKYHDLKIYDDEYNEMKYTWEPHRKFPLVGGRRLNEGYDDYHFAIDISEPKAA
jgi:predicted GNAT family N-acyltransferase